MKPIIQSGKIFNHPHLKDTSNIIDGICTFLMLPYLIILQVESLDFVVSYYLVNQCKKKKKKFHHRITIFGYLAINSKRERKREIEVTPTKSNDQLYYIYFPIIL